MQRYDFEVRQGDDTLAFLRSIEIRNPEALWVRVAELVKSVRAPGGRIRVTNQSGELVVFMGVAAARLLAMHVGVS